MHPQNGERAQRKHEQNEGAVTANKKAMGAGKAGGRGQRGGKVGGRGRGGEPGFSLGKDPEDELPEGDDSCSHGDLGGDGEEEEGVELGAPASAVTWSGRQVKPRRGDLGVEGGNREGRRGYNRVRDCYYGFGEVACMVRAWTLMDA